MKKLKKVSLRKLYICDMKQCGAECHYPDCYHTSDSEHALYSTHDWKNSEISIINQENVYRVDLWEHRSATLDFSYLGSLLRMPN